MIEIIKIKFAFLKIIYMICEISKGIFIFFKKLLWQIQH